MVTKIMGSTKQSPEFGSRLKVCIHEELCPQMTEALWQSIHSDSDRQDLKAVMGAFNRDDGDL
jgi:hypothetical protein